MTAFTCPRGFHEWREQCHPCQQQEHCPYVMNGGPPKPTPLDLLAAQVAQLTEDMETVMRVLSSQARAVMDEVEGVR